MGIAINDTQHYYDLLRYSDIKVKDLRQFLKLFLVHSRVINCGNIEQLLRHRQTLPIPNLKIPNDLLLRAHLQLLHVMYRCGSDACAVSLLVGSVAAVLAAFGVLLV